MIWNAHRPITTTAARLLQRVGGARKTQSVRVERLGAPDLLGLALNTAETPDCDSAPGDSDGDADDCGDVHLGARFQNCGAAWRLATVCEWLGFVAVDLVEGSQANGSRLAPHMAVVAADHVSSEPSRDAGVVAGLCEAAHLSPRLVGGGTLGFCGPGFGGDNPVSDAARKHVRLLLHSLVTDADRLGCGGDGPPEIIDCSLFAHAVLNHSSSESATIDQPVGEKIKTMVDASERLNLAMTHAGVDARALAIIINVPRPTPTK